jgi:hypothetical protein
MQTYRALKQVNFRAKCRCHAGDHKALAILAIRRVNLLPAEPQEKAGQIDSVDGQPT